MLKHIFSILSISVLFCSSTAFSDSQTLFQEIENQNIQQIERIVANQPDLLTSRNQSGDTPVLKAARTGNLQIVSLLLQHGADATAVNNKNRDILNIAVTIQNPDLAKMALAAGANPQMVTSIYQGSALIYASAKGQDAIVDMLIAHQAPVNRINNIGWTALLEVAILGDGSLPYQQIVKSLLKAGADKNIKDKQGKTAYDHAVLKGQTEIATLLSD